VSNASSPGFTVLGLYVEVHETEALYVLQAATWYEAISTVLAESPRGDELQIVGVCAGKVDLLGRWENLPFKPPSSSARALGPRERYTVFGFDQELNAGRADAAEAVGWVELAHAALNHYDTNYALVGVARGVHPFIGTWPEYRDAIIEEELMDASPSAASVQPARGASHQVAAG
jgi:hypothetical protein